LISVINSDGDVNMKMNKLNKINNFKSCFNLCLIVLLLCSFALPGNAFAQQGSDNCIPCSDCDTFELWRFMCTYISQICNIQSLPTEFCEEQRELCDKNIDGLVTRCRGICNANCNGEEEDGEEEEEEEEEDECHTHEDLLWLDNNDYDVKVIEKGCTGTCGTEYLVEFREEFTPGSEDHCGEQAWIWLESGSTPLEVNECYRVYIHSGTGICDPMVVRAYKKTCPECEPTGTCNGGVPDGTCEAGENCPEDAGSCPDNTCMTPTCTDGCGETPISSGSRHRNCNADEGCPVPPCSCDGQGNCIGSENCQTHEDPVWIAGNHILQIMQEGCTEENGCSEMGTASSTEYLVEVKDDRYCGEQLWLWVDEKMNQNPPEIGKCYNSFIMKYGGDCNAYVIRYLYSEVDCPGCEPTTDCHNHENPTWLETNDYELVVMDVGCTTDCGTEYLVEIRRGEHCGEQIWIWRDELGTAPLEVGNCYWTFINTDTSCGYTIDISRKIETCPGCEPSGECANTACGAANTDLPCQCGTARATADAPWCCAKDSNVYPTDFDCITSPSCSDQSDNCRIDISFNKDEFCPGDNLAITLEFLEDDNYIDYTELRATLKKLTESDQDLSEDFTRTDTGIYVTYGGIGNTAGERTLEVEARFGGCEEEASASYTVLSGDDPGITTEFRSNDILKDPTYFGVMVDRIGTSVDISDRYVWQSEGVYIFEGTLGSEGVRTLYATAYFDDGCHATETQDFFVYSTGECPEEPVVSCPADFRCETLTQVIACHEDIAEDGTWTAQESENLRACADEWELSHDIECPSDRLVGDIDGDELITTDDSTIGSLIVAGYLNPPSELCCVDTSNDTRFALSDVQRIEQYIAGNINCFPRGYTCSAPENCNDTIDNNCNGEVNEGCASTACTDTDTGKDYYEKGVVECSGKSFEDRCKRSSITNDDSGLQEFYCQSGNWREVNVKCTDGCVDGACQGTALSPTCTDTDGDNIYTKGSAKDEYGSGQNDCCVASSAGGSCVTEGSHVREGLCISYSNVGMWTFTSRILNCPNGCVDGACIGSPLDCTQYDCPKLTGDECENDADASACRDAWQVDCITDLDVSLCEYEATTSCPTDFRCETLTQVIACYDDVAEDGTWTAQESDNLKTCTYEWELSHDIECPADRLVGDIGGDDLITTDDSTLGSLILVGYLNPPSDLCCIDTSNDTRFALSDVQRIEQYIAGNIDCFPRGYTCSAPENCNDTIDNNCNGEVNEGCASTACTDTDGGKNYYVKGEVYYSVQDFSATDWCREDYILEYYCEGDRYKEFVYKCPNGCKDGACIK